MSLTLSASAEKQIDILTNQGEKVLKIGLKKGGCAGMEYTMDLLEDAPQGSMSIATENGSKVFVDPMAEIFLLGMVIDHKDDLLQSGFIFKNPHVKAACGCGESVGF